MMTCQLGAGIVPKYSEQKNKKTKTKNKKQKN
jgi:hypothetical protein